MTDIKEKTVKKMTDIKEKTVKKIKEVDIYRDTLVRYCGYANEVGESFRPLIPKSAVLATYGVSFAYVFADTADKTVKKWKLLGKNNKNMSTSVKIKTSLCTSTDVVLWQSFASVIVPGFVINRIVWLSKHGIKRVPAIKGTMAKMFPTIIGLASIPLIIHPIDHLVDVVMDKTVRPFLKNVVDSEIKRDEEKL